MGRIEAMSTRLPKTIRRLVRRSEPAGDLYDSSTEFSAHRARKALRDAEGVISPSPTTLAKHVGQLVSEQPRISPATSAKKHTTQATTSHSATSSGVQSETSPKEYSLGFSLHYKGSNAAAVGVPYQIHILEKIIAEGVTDKNGRTQVVKEGSAKTLVLKVHQADAKGMRLKGSSETFETVGEGQMVEMSGIHQVHLPKKRMFLTFDDGPNSSTTVGILSLLLAVNAKATFFLTARPDLDEPVKAPSKPSATRIEIMKGALKAGHAIANHGHNHHTKDHEFGDIEKNIRANQDYYKAILGGNGDHFWFFRSPGGLDASDYKNKIPASIASLKYRDMHVRHVGWDMEFASEKVKKPTLPHVQFDLHTDTGAFVRSTQEGFGPIFKMHDPIVLFHDSHWDESHKDALLWLLERLSSVFHFPLIPYWIHHSKVLPT